MQIQLCDDIAGIETVLATGEVCDDGWGRIDTADVRPGTPANRLYLVNADGGRKHIEPPDGTFALRRDDGRMEWDIITNGGVITISPDVLGG